MVDRLRAGESYYDAMGVELRAATTPPHPFNWRTPLHLAVLALAPWGVWRGLLTALLVGVYVADDGPVRDRIVAGGANV